MASGGACAAGPLDRARPSEPRKTKMVRGRRLLRRLRTSTNLFTGIRPCPPGWRFRRPSFHLHPSRTARLSPNPRYESCNADSESRSAFLELCEEKGAVFLGAQRML